MNAVSNKVSEWRPVVQELDEWARAGIRANFWMRDDDAFKLTPQLDRLTAFARDFSVKIGLAVIPAKLTDPLVKYLNSGEAPYYPMVHGYRHVNYGAQRRPGEFGPERPLALLIDDATSALDAFTDRFKGLSPIFVPPFACITQELVEELPKLGFKGVSTGPTPIERRYARLCARVGALRPVFHKVGRRAFHYDVHIDPFDWGRDSARSAVSMANELVGFLRARRRGFVDVASPIGVLMHHLKFDDPTWAVCAELLAVVAHHPATLWPPVEVIVESEPVVSSSSISKSSTKGIFAD